MGLIAIAAVLADWASKSWALERANDALVPLGALTLGVVHNQGFALSAGDGEISTLVVAAVRMAGLAGFLFLSHRIARLLSPRHAYGVALIVAGGMGNLADLFFRGAVVDFIGAGPFVVDWGSGPLHMHVVFNVADLFILIGIGMIAPFLQEVGKAGQRRLAAWERRILRRGVQY